MANTERPAKTLKDSFGRVINNLRISVTDRCNFRCTYCMPEEGLQWMKKSELLTFEEIARLTGVVSRLGITKIRLTGGEPLMRKDLSRLVRMIHAEKGITDLALTTNAYFLEEQAEELVGAGLSRINISLDSLDPKTFSSLNRRDEYERVWRGIRKAESLGISPIKLNAVLIRGVNDADIEEFAKLARTGKYVIRFIEFMPIGAGDGWSKEKVVSTREIIGRINRIEEGVTLLPVEYHGAQPADRYRFSDGKGEIGFISSVSEPFCSHCNRIRLTSDGKLRTCLFSLHETDLKSLLRVEKATDEEIEEHILKAVWEKEEGHLINQPGFERPVRTMSQIGG
jgi:cyclic pyranopterin phosphate synthase